MNVRNHLVLIVWLIVFFMLSTLLAYSLYFFVLKTGDHRNVDIGPLIYAVALAFITFFTVFNCMEIYKKKDDFERQLASILEKHIEIKNKVETLHLSFNYDYRDMESNVRRLKLEVEERARELYLSIDARYIDQLDKIEKKLEPLKNELEFKVDNTKALIDAYYEELKSAQVTVEGEFRRHLYTYTLYSIIPQFLTDPKNRRDVENSFYWFSQHGNDEELEMMRERFSKIHKDDAKMIELAEHCIRELERILRIQRKK